MEDVELLKAMLAEMNVSQEKAIRKADCEALKANYEIQPGKGGGQ
jgi:hypothetical protein